MSKGLGVIQRSVLDILSDKSVDHTYWRAITEIESLLNRGTKRSIRKSCERLVESGHLSKRYRIRRTIHGTHTRYTQYSLKRCAQLPEPCYPQSNFIDGEYQIVAA